MTTETAHLISPSAPEAWQLVGHYLHRLSHELPKQWRLRDHVATQCREKVWSLPTEHGTDVQVALWLRLSDTEVPCSDSGCAAREMYLTSDGTGRVPASGALPAFARREGLGYFEYRTHPHHDGWVSDVDPVLVQWMSTALALYGGWIRINWFDMGGANSMGVGHSLWEVAGHQVQEISRWSTVAGPGGVRDEGPTNPSTTPVLPLPPEVEAKRQAAAEARR